MRNRMTSALVSSALALCMALCVPHTNGRLGETQDSGSATSQCEVFISLDYGSGLWTLTDVTPALGSNGVRVQTYTDVVDADAFVTALRTEFVVC